MVFLVPNHKDNLWEQVRPFHLCYPWCLEQHLAQSKHSVKWCSYPRSHSQSSPDSQRASSIRTTERAGTHSGEVLKELEGCTQNTEIEREQQGSLSLLILCQAKAGIEMVQGGCQTVGGRQSW